MREAHQRKIAAKAAALKSRLGQRQPVLNEGGPWDSSSFSSEVLHRDDENKIIFQRAFPASDELSSSFDEAELTLTTVERRLADVRSRRAARGAC